MPAGMRSMLACVAVALGVVAISSIAPAGAQEAYPPPSTPAQPLVTPSTVAQGGSITVEWDGCAAGSPVTVTLLPGGTTLGTITADGSGHASGTFTVPAGTSVGVNTVHLSCTDPNGAARVADVQITVEGASVSKGGLAFTGSDSTGLAIVGVGAVVLGLALVVVASRRRSTASTG